LLALLPPIQSFLTSEKKRRNELNVRRQRKRDLSDAIQTFRTYSIFHLKKNSNGV